MRDGRLSLLGIVEWFDAVIWPVTSLLVKRKPPERQLELLRLGQAYHERKLAAAALRRSTARMRALEADIATVVAFEAEESASGYRLTNMDGADINGAGVVLRDAEQTKWLASALERARADCEEKHKARALTLQSTICPGQLECLNGFLHDACRARELREQVRGARSSCLEQLQQLPVLADALVEYSFGYTDLDLLMKMDRTALSAWLNNVVPGVEHSHGGEGTPVSQSQAFAKLALADGQAEAQLQFQDVISAQGQVQDLTHAVNSEAVAAIYTPLRELKGLQGRAARAQQALEIHVDMRAVAGLSNTT